MEPKVDYEAGANKTDQVVSGSALYEEFAGLWYCHVYVLAFGFFCIAFCCFFSAINIRSQYGQQSLMFIACVLQMFSGTMRTAFFMLDAYGADERLPLTLLTFVYALVFPCISSTVAMTVFSIAKHCLRTEPKSFVWLIIFCHFCFSISAEIIAANEDTWRFLLQAVTTIFMLWPLGLLLLFYTIRKNILEVDSPAPVSAPIKEKTEERPRKVPAVSMSKNTRRSRKRFTESAAQTSFIRKPPSSRTQPKSKSCGTINDTSAGSQLTIPTSSVVSLNSLESWENISLQDSPRNADSPVICRHFSMPSVITSPTKRFRFHFKFHTPSLGNLTSRKLAASPGQRRRPSDGRNGGSFERELISGEESDLTVHKDQDSTVINYFTSAPQHTVPNNAPKTATQMQGDTKAPTSHLPGKSLITNALWSFVRAHYILMSIYLTYCALYLYSVFRCPLDINAQNRASVWDWFVFESLLRITELMVCISLASIVDHAGTLDNCNLVRQRDLLRV